MGLYQQAFGERSLHCRFDCPPSGVPRMTEKIGDAAFTAMPRDPQAGRHFLNVSEQRGSSEVVRLPRCQRPPVRPRRAPPESTWRTRGIVRDSRATRPPPRRSRRMRHRPRTPCRTYPCAHRRRAPQERVRVPPVPARPAHVLPRSSISAALCHFVQSATNSVGAGAPIRHPSRRQIRCRRACASRAWTRAIGRRSSADMSRCG